MRIPTALSTKEGLSKKLIIGFTALASAALIGTVSMASAMNGNSQPPGEFCQNGDYKNHGQCVKAWKHQQNKPGYPGGGDDKSVHLNVDADIEGDNNVINIVINYFFN